MSAAIEDVIAERHRQITSEGWEPEHDDEHTEGSLATAGAAYALHAGRSAVPRRRHTYAKKPPGFWPFDHEFWKPKTPRRDLVRAAALLIAEIERIDRLEAKG